MIPSFMNRVFRIVQIASGVALAGGFGVYLLTLCFPEGPGRFDRVRMDTIVDEVRRQMIESAIGVNGDNITEFKIEDFGNAKSLRIVPADQRGHVNVWARRMPDGALEVSILTNDRGHLGAYGFAYSDAPLSSIREEGMSYLKVPGPMMYPGGSIDKHWWKIYNNDR